MSATRKSPRTWCFLATALLLPPSLATCARVSPEPNAVVVAPGELPRGARFVPVGNIGEAYRLQGGGAARFPAPREGAAALLPGTIRLFRFDEQRSAWAEIPGSRFDERTGELVGDSLAPGYYTAFGWSRNPAENAVQRILSDMRRGLRPERGAPTSQDSLRAHVASVPAALRSALMRDWVQWSFTLDQTTCQTHDMPGCHDICRRRAREQKLELPSQRTALASCPGQCPDAPCCTCETFAVTERFWIPESIFATPLLSCTGVPGGPTCPVCLSCANGALAAAERIRPTLEIPDYRFMDGIRLGGLVADVALRDIMHDMVEETLGRQYPVPPPWP